jgi:hypothetical protein
MDELHRLEISLPSLDLLDHMAVETHWVRMDAFDYISAVASNTNPAEESITG